MYRTRPVASAAAVTKVPLQKMSTTHDTARHGDAAPHKQQLTCCYRRHHCFILARREKAGHNWAKSKIRWIGLVQISISFLAFCFFYPFVVRGRGGRVQFTRYSTHTTRNERNKLELADSLLLYRHGNY